MKISIEFHTDNAAFDDDCSFDDQGRAEITRILQQLALRVQPEDSGVVIDVNGNAIGEWSWE